MAERIKGGQRPSNEPKNKMFCLVFGDAGVGKSSFLLSMPSPIWFINIDKAIGELSEKLPDHYELEYTRIQYDVDATPAVANSVLNIIDKEADKALAEAKAGNAGSFAIDGFDLLWEYVKVAKLPHSSGDRNVAREYGDANLWMKDLLTKLYFSPLAVGLSAISKEIWKKESSGSGKYEAGGFKGNARWMTHEVMFFSPEDTAPSAKPIEGQTGQSHRAYIRVSKHNEALVRKVVPNLSYKTLFKLTYGVLPEGADKLWTPSSSSQTLASQ